MQVRCLLLLFVLLLNACTTLKAKREYDDAIEHFEDGDYDSAIECLERTIDLCPEDAKYYNSIALVYFEKGDLINSWTYCRKTLQCADPPKEAFFMFEQLFGMMCAKFKIVVGMREDELVEKFGVPDKIIESDSSEIKAYIYGISLFYIKYDHIAEAFFRGNPEPWDPINLDAVSFPKLKKIPTNDL